MIGHLDAGEADHAGWLPGNGAPAGAFRWGMNAGDGERVPWHDMASHGSFVLLGGGLGSRYAGGQDETLHGYGSDDYLSVTVLGGRNPMCDGPFSRRAVMTYWLLHDVCNSLAREELLSDEFAGDDIHRQTARFSGGGVARVNRGRSDWTAGDAVLPPYGFIATAGGNEAEITRRDGVICACAKSPGILFVDARPATGPREGEVIARVTGVDDLGQRRFRVHIDWQVLQPVVAGFQPFVHLVDEKQADREGIVFQCAMDWDPAQLGKAGTYSSTGEATVPAGMALPAKFAIRFGLYHASTDGLRLPMPVALDATGRARGGAILVEKAGIRWQPEPAQGGETGSGRVNIGGRLIDFGPAVTNGAFRLLHGGPGWTLIPLPGAAAFQATLRLDRLGARGRKVLAVTALAPDGSAMGPVKFEQNLEAVQLDSPAGVFACRIALTGWNGQ